jgi:hypothetical protein
VTPPFSTFWAKTKKSLALTSALPAFSVSSLAMAGTAALVW